MANNDSDDFVAKLSRLSPQERKVLGYRCQGWDYATIAKSLGIDKKSVKTYMDRIYNKLELKPLGRAERMKILFEKYGPLLQEMKKEPEKVEVVAGEVVPSEEIPQRSEPSISPEDEKMIDEDEYAIVLTAPAPLMHKLDPKPRARTRWLAILIAGVVLGICVGGVAVFLVLRSNNGSIPLVTQSTPTVSRPTTIPSDTALPSPTSVIPSQTPLVIQQVIVVTATPPPQPKVPTSLPTSAISLPFTDNFDNGPSSSWKVLSGNWITVDGRFTPLSPGDQNNWFWAILDEPSWQNYRVSANIHIPYAYSAAQGQLAVVVRISSSQTKYLGFYVNFNMRGGWALIGSGYFDEQSISGLGQDVPDSASIDIEANGNSFTARVNGQTYQQVTLPGYEQGGVGIGVLCQADKCPSFDNFKVEPIGP